MKFFRYRRPSLNTLLGITRAKKRLKKELGITAALKPFRAWTNAKRRFKRKIGYESKAGRLIRDGLPRPGGCLVLVVIFVVVLAICAVAMPKIQNLGQRRLDRGGHEALRFALPFGPTSRDSLSCPASTHCASESHPMNLRPK